MKKPTNSSQFTWDEVYSRLRAAEEVLHRSEPAQSEVEQILRSRATALARRPESGDGEGPWIEVVEFSLGQERYGLESRKIREVVPLRELTTLSGTPAFLLGVVNVRGRILPVLDLKIFFDLPRQGLTDMNKLLVLEGAAGELGILADAILGVSKLALKDLQPALPTLTGAREELLLGIGPDRMTVLNAEKILNDPRLRTRVQATRR